MYDVIICSL